MEDIRPSRFSFLYPSDIIVNAFVGPNGENGLYNGQFTGKTFTMNCPGYDVPQQVDVLDETPSDGLDYSNVDILIPADFVAHQCTIAEGPIHIFGSLYPSPVPPFAFHASQSLAVGILLAALLRNVAATLSTTTSDGTPISIPIR